MKILLVVTNSFCSNLIRGQARFLIDEGHQVIIVSKKGKEIMHLAATENCRHIEVDFVKDISPFKDLHSLYQIIKIISKEKPDIINAGNPKPGFLFSLTHFIFPKIKYVFTLRGLRSDTLTGPKKFIVLFTEWLTCSLVNKVIIISPSLKEHVLALGVCSRHKGLVINSGSSNGINFRRFENNHLNSEKGKRLRKKLNIAEEDFVFLYIGRIAKDKGIEDLYNAFKMFSSQNVKLIIAGPVEKDDPIDNSILNSIIEDKRVFLFDKVKSTEILYAAANVFILFSRREGFGNVVLEAGSMQLPAIISDIPGLRDTIINNYTGLYVEKRNVDKLLSAMQYYFYNRSVAILHGENARRRAVRCFDSKVIWKGQLNIYNNLYTAIK